MRFILFTAVIGLFVTSVGPAHGQEKEAKPERIGLWNKRAPIGDGKFQETEVWITVHRPKNPNGTAIVICPGGGYGGLVTGAEGHGIAAWLNRHGITGVVLEYRLPAARSQVPLLDAQRALRTARANAKAWNIEPARIGIMGFSAGGHLASTAGTHFDTGEADASDPVERVSCRPDFMILVYPVISMTDKGHQGSRNNLLGKNPDAKLVEMFSNEKQVTAKTPPAFLAHAKDDRAVPSENSRMFYDALRANKVAAHYLELPSGGHGLNGYKGPMWDAWQEQALAWLAEMKFVPAAKCIGEDWDYVLPMKKIAAKFRGNEGVVIHVGGSMTIANPYGTWPRTGKGKTEADQAILQWMHTEKKDKTDGWWLCRTEVVHYRAHTAESGLKSAMLLAGGKRGLPTLEKMLDEYKPRMLTIECGIYDVEDGVPLEDYRTNMAKALDLILAQGAIPILNTIPPFKAQFEKTRQFNEALRTLAKERGIPVIDLEREILQRRPDDWFGALMNRIHLTASDGGGSPGAEPTPENLRKSGYQLRGWLTVQKVAEIKNRVLDAP